MSSLAVKVQKVCCTARVTCSEIQESRNLIQALLFSVFLLIHSVHAKAGVSDLLIARPADLYVAKVEYKAFQLKESSSCSPPVCEEPVGARGSD